MNNELIERQIDALNHLVEHTQEGIEKCFELIEKVESYMTMEDRITVSDVILRLHTIETKQDYFSTQLVDTKKDIAELHEGYRGVAAELKYVMENISADKNNNKKPHKCPVCDGSGKTKLFIMPSSYDLINCHSCDGSGIVWN